jgi:ATP-dependent Clp protease ATP-binding subunit ClpA
MGVPSDAANIFKSSLSRGEVRIIGATTATEYKEYFLEDEALARRFRVVNLTEPSIEDTWTILKGVRPRLESNYSVKITDEALETAIEMSSRYMRFIRLPDKAIGWLDTASVKVEINRPDKPVTRDDIIEVISQEAGIPKDGGVGSRLTPRPGRTRGGSDRFVARTRCEPRGEDMSPPPERPL